MRLNPKARNIMKKEIPILNNGEDSNQANGVKGRNTTSEPVNPAMNILRILISRRKTTAVK